jgi:hypothetical protein
MTRLDQNLSQGWKTRPQPEVVVMPRQHQGVRDALIGSFSIPSMPPEFVRLLERIR